MIDESDRAELVRLREDRDRLHLEAERWHGELDLAQATIDRDVRDLARLRRVNAELAATVERLKSRGIEDMQHRIAELEAAYRFKRDEADRGIARIAELDEQVDVQAEITALRGVFLVRSRRQGEGTP
jgi:hypothetical protein